MRLSCAFQQETPTRLQTKEAEVLVNLQVLILSSGSVRESLRPWRQTTSSSIATATAKKEEKKKKKKKR